MMRFIEFKGTDIFKRQIFFLFLNKVELLSIDNDHLMDPLIIYLIDCNLIILI
jgi:hypothetical protein